MYGRRLRFTFLWCASLCLCLCAVPVYSQILQEETLAGADAHETAENTKGYLFGEWGGVRTRLLERGVKLDLHSISDSLWNIKSQQNERFASYNRVRGTVDIDLGKLVHQQGWSFHATAVWQTGNNLGSYLGLVANPSSIASMNTFRLDSWWFQKSWLKNRIAIRAGQFAGQDSYGDQNFGKSFVAEPIGGALDNLSNTFETFDPPSTPALEIHVVPIHDVYVKSMVLSQDRLPFSNNPTGLVPYFHGPPVSVSEIGFTPGKKASSMVPTDNATTRKGYSGLYQFGASYNPGKFSVPMSATPRSANYLLYWIASQAVWRPDPKEAKGLDATLSYDWSPRSINSDYTMFAAGLRFNEPLPLKIHNTMSLGYVQNSLSPQFLPSGAPAWQTEHGVEFNTLLNVLPMIIVQPVIQYYANVGGGAQRAVVFGFRTKVEF